MAESAVVFDHVSKVFDLHRSHSRSFQELVVNFGRRQPRMRDDLHALQDISFTIERGTTVGFIGANGAGKSTLLKLIARILEPDSGAVTVKGRVGALLELGAGFHPDLTGRENVYLNASIMGLSRREVDRRFDEIVAFAELERFIDVPVKHYSSGMYVRLGFAVAVNIEPEILLVDEVLAVGDAAFQRKCFDRIDRMRAGGITLLFVSHSADAVRTHCSRAIWLDSGVVRADGTAEAVVQRYTTYAWEKDQGRLQAANGSRWGTGRIQVTRVQLLNREGEETRLFKTGEPLTVVLHYQAAERIEYPVFGLAIHRSDGVHITGPNTRLAGMEIPYIEGIGQLSYTMDAIPLLPGTYAISVAATSADYTEMFDYHDRLYPFRVHAAEGEMQFGMIVLAGRWGWSAAAG
ncbi:MAG TPA: ABC transporter ATP-binding protein [Anaerolineae bacterium]|nr:ABC transporter ATP-binding protein [Anaerolineae bacterium]HQH38543.1 ABC transporter ATP-binding protein [Anaerolineae bacterium]